METRGSSTKQGIRVWRCFWRRSPFEIVFFFAALLTKKDSAAASRWCGVFSEETEQGDRIEIRQGTAVSYVDPSCGNLERHSGI